MSTRRESKREKQKRERHLAALKPDPIPTEAVARAEERVEPVAVEKPKVVKKKKKKKKDNAD